MTKDLVELIHSMDADSSKAVDMYNDWSIKHQFRYRKNYGTLREYRIHSEKSFRKYMSIYYNKR